MYSLEDVFQQAVDDNFAGNVNGKGYEARIANGVKVSKDNHTKEIEFFNVTRGGAYYQKLTHKEIESFLEKGWKHGAYVLSLSNNRLRLDLIELSIRKEINSKNNPATLKSLRGRRDKTLAKYNHFNQLINNFTHGAD